MGRKRRFGSLMGSASETGDRIHHSSKRQKQAHTESDVPSEAASKASPIAQASHTRGGEAIAVKQESSVQASRTGLSKTQKQRRAQLRRTEGLDAADKYVASVLAQPRPELSSRPTNASPGKRQADLSKQKALDHGLVRRATATKLLIPPKKRWTEDQEERRMKPRDHGLLRCITATTLLVPPEKQWIDGPDERAGTANVNRASAQAADTEHDAAAGSRLKTPPERLQAEATDSPPFGSDTAMMMHQLESPQIHRQQVSRSGIGRAYSALPNVEQRIAADKSSNESSDESSDATSDGSSVHSVLDEATGDGADSNTRAESPALRTYVSDDAPAPAEPVVEGDSSDEASLTLRPGNDAEPRRVVESSTAQALFAESENDDESSVDLVSDEDDNNNNAETARLIDRSDMLPQAALSTPVDDGTESPHVVDPSPLRQQAVLTATDGATNSALLVRHSSIGSTAGLSSSAQLYNSTNRRFGFAPLAQPKANSVPSTSNGEDVRAVFKRFSAMVKGKDDDSSDDDSDGDDSTEEESEHSADEVDAGERRQKDAGMVSILTSSLVQTEQPSRAPVETAVEAESESESNGEEEIDHRPATLCSAIDHVKTRPEAPLQTAHHGEGEEADETDRVSDNSDGEDDGQATFSALDGSNDTRAGHSADKFSAVGDASKDDQGTELAPVVSLGPHQQSRADKSRTFAEGEEVDSSSEDDDMGSSDGDDAEAVPEFDNNELGTESHLSDADQVDKGLLPSLQPQAAPKDIAEISDSESEPESSAEDGSDLRGVVDSPMQSVNTTTPPHAAQLKNELAAASQTSMPGLSQIATQLEGKVVSLDRKTSGTASGQALVTEVRDEDEVLYKTIDEVSEHLFASTRPLPPCKPEQFPTEGEDTRLTESRHRDIAATDVRRRVATEVSIPRATLLPTADVVRCYSVRVPEFEHDVVLGGQGLLATACGGTDGQGKEAPVSDDHAVLPLERVHSSSSLSELGRTPSPPAELLRKLEVRDNWREDDESEYAPAAEVRKKRRMTGMTSKHFSPAKRSRRRSSAKDVAEPYSGVQQASLPEEAVDAAAAADRAAEAKSTAVHTPSPAKRSTKPKRKSTGTKSEHFLPFHLLDRVDLPTPTKGRIPAGVSRAPVPPISSERFGIIQEKLWDQPFWSLVAVTFLNKTTGRAAVPTFWALKERYPTPEDLASADQEAIHDMIRHLGLQTQRSRRLIKMAGAWLVNPPAAGKRYKTTNYPAHGDHKEYNRIKVVEGDAADCKGALEIGHIPGCGAYAWDSWRMYCRDVLRGVADNYNGKGAQEEDFQPEWQKVLADDKELRATLRWMWLREGWIWNHETGEKRRATGEEMERAVKGQMDVADPAERKFAAQAAGVEMPKEPVLVASVEEHKGEEQELVDANKADDTHRANAQRSGGTGEEVVVASKPKRKAVKRSTRRTTIA
ncbi:hypothetical protein LTR85_002207 [Meristemomyces frigidus]|nr:hypothetical protein LTR85_002207 [Meristemomyces frigidus]